ncbi:siphovirus Gp157 family protein [Rhizorhabdus wittichii]|uniref:siphovirus Gp157 family protein n=1 Tax=Rhizorhabdus wittichii TaxID=160791 RepID=UPI0002EE6EA4|nr:siphovirus Gp157 family protein [Rhizorhabdus wittichii]
MNAPAPIRVDIVTREIAQVAEVLLVLCDGDGRLYADMLAGETDIEAACSKLLEMIEAEEGVFNALTEQMSKRKARRDAAEARIKTMKNAIQKIMSAGMIKTLKLPEATLSIRPVAASLKVVDPEAVPEEFTVSTSKPSMEKIKQTYNPDGALPNWLAVEPERQSVSIRRS